MQEVGVDYAAVLDVQNSVVVISPVQVVVVDLHWSVLEVHVQDADASELFWLSETVGMMTSRARLALETCFEAHGVSLAS